MQLKKDLALIVPVYNEEGAIESVINKWVLELERLKIQFDIHLYNDGSTDSTLKKVLEINKLHPNVVAHDKQNSGHGPTILQGYCEQTPNYHWLFQIDSDDELGPEEFDSLWRNRNSFDFLLGHRKNRAAPLSRKVTTLISRLAVYLFYGSRVKDVNSPYRLMRTDSYAPLFPQIPIATFAPNLLVSGYTSRKQLRVYEVPVAYRERQTGEVSIKKWKLFKAANKSLWQTLRFAFQMR